MAAKSHLPARAVRGRRKTARYQSFIICFLFASLSIGALPHLHRAKEVEDSTGLNQQGAPGAAQRTEIILLSPPPGTLIVEPRPIFRWKLSSLSDQLQPVSYRFKIVELRQDQTLEEALMKNASVLERGDLAQDSFQFPDRTKLLAGKIYAWRVTAFTGGTEVGRSGPEFFGVKTWPTWTFCFLLLYAPSFNYCIGQMTTVTVANAFMTGTGAYSWTLTGPTLGSGSSNSPTITIPAQNLPTTPGTYTYQLTVTHGTCTQTVNFTVVVDVPPVAGTITVTPSKPLYCPGEDAVLTLSGQSVFGLIQWYEWSNQLQLFNHPIAGAFGNTTQNTNPLYSTTSFGVEVSSPNGACPPVFASVQLNVKPPPVPIVSGPAVLCFGASGIMNVVSGSCTSFQWYCDGLPCGSNSSSLPVAGPGNYSVECFDGCQTVMSNVITIQQDLLAVTISGPCCPCKGQKIQLCAQAVNGKPPYTYQWSGGGTTQCKLVIPTATTTYSVIVTDANGCQATGTFTATVCP